MGSAHLHGSADEPSACSPDVHTDTLEDDIGRELGRHPFRSGQAFASPPGAVLGADHTSLDRRMREWRGLAKVVEQSHQQLVAAEQERSEVLSDLHRIEGDVARAAQAVTKALAGLDAADEMLDIDPLFARSQEALDELDRAINELSAAEVWCRTAWKHYAEAAASERVLRFNIQASDLMS
jgi:chromosome segregation ATPase